MKNLRFVCRFLRMSFFCACPGISPQRCLAHSLPERFSQGHIPFGRSFSFQFAPQLVGSEKAHLLTPSIINWELFCRLHERIFVNRLCYSENFNVCYFRDPGRLSNRSGAAAISFDGCLVFHFRYSVVDSAMRARYSIAYRTLVRQVILTYCCRKSGCRFRQPTLQKLSLINMGFSDSSKNPQYLLQFPSKRLSAVRHPSTAACPKRI